VALLALVIGGARGQPGITACAAGSGKDHFPFCNTSLPLDDRVWDLVNRINDSDKGNLLTARGHGRVAESEQAIPELGVPAYYWCVVGVHDPCFSMPFISC
jgi:hypothetical protein